MVDELDLSAYDLAQYESYSEAVEEFEWKIPNTFNLGRAIIDRNAQKRGRVALFWDNQKGADEIWTFWQLRQRTNQFCNALSEVGIERGDVVGICLPERPETVISHTGTWKYGAVSLPLPVILGDEGLEYRLAHSESRAVLVHDNLLDEVRDLYNDLDQLEHIIIVGDESPEHENEYHFDDFLDKQPVEASPAETKAEEDALLVYTSGTTGDPKGVMHAHRVMLGTLPGFNMKYNVNTDGVYYTAVDWSWMGSLTTIMPALLTGQTIVGSNYTSFKADEQLSILERYGVTHGNFPPTALNILREGNDSGYDIQLRVIVSGGEALSPETLTYWRSREIPILEGYGQTESNPLICNCEYFFDVKKGSMGRPVPGHEIQLRKNGEPVEQGEVGEIALKRPDPAQLKRYVGEVETEEYFEGDWFLTGDLAREDENGYFWFKSRADDVIISSGYRISPVEVENTIIEHPSVAEVGVAGVPDDIRGNIVKAFVKTHSPENHSDDLKLEIQSLVKDQLAKYEYPREVEFVEEFPTSVTGKIKRSSLTD
ncbi:acyl-CoA synthetase [Natrinema caseinilyticum]|uniref:acyl-CoA synthetase n=1 Tax=Natrinema caseinilyticum TaxID=2961570 RepID=UPI0020C38296|nr:AMP-binding protein [Natrinema caseinilyticum]